MAQAREFLGIVQVPLLNLQFKEDLGERLYDDNHTIFLKELFAHTAIDLENCKNWINGYVDYSDVEPILYQLELSPQGLQGVNQENYFPPLDQSFVWYTQGRHRIEAAKAVDPSLQWTVRLFSTDLPNFPSNEVIRKENEEYLHEKPFSDAKTYAKLREYKTQRLDYQRWKARLKKYKQKAFAAINQRLDISAALNGLMELPAIFEGLQLGNYPKYFSLHLDEEIYAGLDQVYKKWSMITCGNQTIMHCLDPKSLRALEGRAPTVSQPDRDTIRSAFQSGSIFTSLRNPEWRTLLERTICETPGIIPSLRTFHANMGFLSIIAQIIWDHLMSDDLKNLAKVEKLTLSSILKIFWVAPAPYVEVREGEFRPVKGLASFHLAYSQLILSALRQFPHLARDGPRVESRKEPVLSLDPTCVSLFQRRASLLGFRNPKIDQGASVAMPQFVSRCSTASGNGLPLDHINESSLYSKVERRWGRPYSRAFCVAQRLAFLPQLHERDVATTEVTVQFVVGEFLDTFLRPCNFEIDCSRPGININHSSRNFYRPHANRTSGEMLPTISEEFSRDVSVEGSHRMDVDSAPVQLMTDQQCDFVPRASSDATTLGDIDVTLGPDHHSGTPPASCTDQTGSVYARSDVPPDSLIVDTERLGRLETLTVPDCKNIASSDGQMLSNLPSRAPSSPMPISPFNLNPAASKGSPVIGDSLSRCSSRPRSTMPSPPPLVSYRPQGTSRNGRSGQSPSHDRRPRILTEQKYRVRRPQRAQSQPNKKIFNSRTAAEQEASQATPISVSTNSSVYPQSILSTPKGAPPLLVQLLAADYLHEVETITQERRPLSSEQLWWSDGSSVVRSTAPTPPHFPNTPRPAVSARSIQGYPDISTVSLSQANIQGPYLGHNKTSSFIRRQLSSGTSISSPPRSTCPTPQSYKLLNSMSTSSPQMGRNIERERERERPSSNWQGFDDSNDDMVSIDF